VISKSLTLAKYVGTEKVKEKVRKQRCQNPQENTMLNTNAHPSSIVIHAKHHQNQNSISHANHARIISISHNIFATPASAGVRSLLSQSLRR
jgi:hypothetical protein